MFITLKTLKYFRINSRKIVILESNKTQHLPKCRKLNLVFKNCRIVH